MANYTVTDEHGGTRHRSTLTITLTGTNEGLTPTERKVAQLVAAGRTNREVAAELFLSVKTVEAYLTRIYRKQGVRSRTELARVLLERSPEPG